MAAKTLREHGRIANHREELRRSISDFLGDDTPFKRAVRALEISDAAQADEMPVRFVDAFIQANMDGLSYRQTAERLGVPISAVERVWDAFDLKSNARPGRRRDSAETDEEKDARLLRSIEDICLP